MEGLQDCFQKVWMVSIQQYNNLHAICTNATFYRYASLYFAAGIEKEDNELIVLDIIHHFVETLDRYFGNVCELDLIFNFH